MAKVFTQVLAVSNKAMILNDYEMVFSDDVRESAYVSHIGFYFFEGKDWASGSTEDILHIVRSLFFLNAIQV